MALSKLLSVMMEFYSDVRFSEHAVKCYSYAWGIGSGEGLLEQDMFILSAAAILHDVGIPKAKEIYGSGKGEFQEKEGALLVPGLLEKADINGITERVVWLVGHHHTQELAEADKLLQILMEADYLVNFAEHNTSLEMIREVRKSFFKTATGKQYMIALFGN